MKRIVLVAVACSVICSAISAAIAVRIAREPPTDNGDVMMATFNQLAHIEHLVDSESHRLDGLRARIEILEHGPHR